MPIWIGFMACAFLVAFVYIAADESQWLWGPFRARNLGDVAPFPDSLDEMLASNNITGRQLLEWLQTSSHSPCRWNNRYTVVVGPKKGRVNFWLRRVELPTYIDHYSMDGLRVVAHESGHVQQSILFRWHVLLQELALTIAVLGAVGAGVLFVVGFYVPAVVFVLGAFMAIPYKQRWHMGLEAYAVQHQHSFLAAWLPYSSLSVDEQAKILKASEEVTNAQMLWYPALASSSLLAVLVFWGLMGSTLSLVFRHLMTALHFIG